MVANLIFYTSAPEQYVSLNNEVSSLQRKNLAEVRYNTHSRLALFTKTFN